MNERLQKYIRLLEQIREEKMLSKSNLFRILNISSVTGSNIYKGKPIAFKTMQKIKQFVDKHVEVGNE